MTEQRPPPSWFWNAVLDGIQRLVVLRLDGAPAGDTIPAVQRTWVEALWPGRVWHQERDEPRIREAFRRLTTFSSRWPSPSDLRRHLPPEYWGQRYRALPPIDHTPERRALARREIAKLRKRFNLGDPEQ